MADRVWLMGPTICHMRSAISARRIHAGRSEARLASFSYSARGVAAQCACGVRGHCFTHRCCAAACAICAADDSICAVPPAVAAHRERQTPCERCQSDTNITAHSAPKRARLHSAYATRVSRSTGTDSGLSSDTGPTTTTHQAGARRKVSRTCADRDSAFGSAVH
jgi:hypothetical protein